jgi:predicted amidohydrolase
MPKKVLSIAAVQMKCRKGDVEWNLRHSVDLIRRAIHPPVDLVCFPESVLDGYACGEPRHARSASGKEARTIARLAAEYNIWVAWSLAEKVGEAVGNTVLVFDRQGRMRLRYRKSHLCMEADEHKAYRAGARFPVVSMDGIPVGVMICFDRHFPEVARELRLRGARLILHPTATDWFKPDLKSLNTAMMRTRAYENGCFILSVNQANYGGGSALFGPWGEVMACGGNTEKIFHWRVNLDALASIPDNYFDLVHTRRPDLYGRINQRGFRV